MSEVSIVRCGRRVLGLSTPPPPEHPLSFGYDERHKNLNALTSTYLITACSWIPLRSLELPHTNDPTGRLVTKSLAIKPCTLIKTDLLTPYGQVGRLI